MDSNSCSSCAEKDSPNCPLQTQITIQSEINELTQQITIIFSPPLTNILPSPFQLTAKTLIEKHFSLKFKRKEEAESIEIKIINEKLTHDSDSSKLLIEFLQKMRVSNTEYIDVDVKDPWVYKSASGSQLVYFKKKEVKISIKKKEDGQREQDEKQVAEIAKASRLAIGAIAAASSATIAFTGSSTFFAYLTKFFNIIDILSNLAKINVKLGPRFKLVMIFLENLKIPEIGFLANLSPVKDSDFDEPDSDAYKLIPRGTRGKMTEEGNDGIFITSGQNFFFSLTILLFWLLWLLFRLCFSERSKVLSLISFFYQFSIDLFIFDFQLICTTEIAFFNYNRMRGVPGKFVGSLLISTSILVLIVKEFSGAFDSIGEEVKRKNERKQNKSLSKSEQLIVDLYTEGIEIAQNGKKSNSFHNNLHYYLLWIGNVRFFVIQVVIASLQLLNRT